MLLHRTDAVHVTRVIYRVCGNNRARVIRVIINVETYEVVVCLCIYVAVMRVRWMGDDERLTN